MNKGQLLKAIRQVKYSGITTIFVFGKRYELEEYPMFSPENIEGTEFKPCSVAISTSYLIEPASRRG
jgi:hypothetical protein